MSDDPDRCPCGAPLPADPCIPDDVEVCEEHCPVCREGDE